MSGTEDRKETTWTPQQFAAAVCGALKACTTPEEIGLGERWVEMTTREYERQVCRAVAATFRREAENFARGVTNDFAMNGMLSSERIRG